jgi:hypothetical protein
MRNAVVLRLLLTLCMCVITCWSVARSLRACANGIPCNTWGAGDGPIYTYTYGRCQQDNHFKCYFGGCVDVPASCWEVPCNDSPDHVCHYYQGPCPGKMAEVCAHSPQCFCRAQLATGPCPF